MYYWLFENDLLCISSFDITWKISTPGSNCELKGGDRKQTENGLSYLNVLWYKLYKFKLKEKKKKKEIDQYCKTFKNCRLSLKQLTRLAASPQIIPECFALHFMKSHLTVTGIYPAWD